MADWLQQARAQSAGLSLTLTGEHTAALRRGIDVRLQRRRTARRLAGAGVAAGLLLVLVWANAVRTPAAVELARPATPASASESAPAMRALAVQPAQSAWKFNDGSQASVLVRETELQLERDDATGTRLMLHAGAARFAVQPRAGRPFVVSAGVVEVRVIGTRFDVMRANDVVEVVVEHGVVQVVTPSSVVLLHAGERQRFGAREAASVLATDATQPELPRAPEPVVTPLARKPRAAPAALAARDEAGELLAAADRARREGRAADAVALLDQLLQRHPGDPRAASAAFSLGRVLLETQKQPERAAAAFARVGALDPRSPIAEDALARQVEAWARAGSADRARALAERYLQRYPGGTRVAFVRAQAGLE